MLMPIWLTITHYSLDVLGHGSMHLIGFDKMLAHVMCYKPMIKVLSTHILTNQLIRPCLIMPYPVILSAHPIILGVSQ